MSRVPIRVEGLDIRFDVPLVRGAFGSRLNRFVAEVDIADECEAVHVPNTGRMAELLVSGAEVALAPRSGSARKTRYDLTLVRYEGEWVCVDASAANRAADHLLRAAAEGSAAVKNWPVEEEVPKPLQDAWGRLVDGVDGVRREVRFGRHRIDFSVDKGARQVPIEVKSVNLVVEGVARFPDAPTARGAQHVRFLADWAKKGGESHLIFAVQRSDAASFTPNDQTDPDFARELRAAVCMGVGVHVLMYAASPAGLHFAGLLPIKL